jgi:hypothetical protein
MGREGQSYETLAICRSLTPRAAFTGGDRGEADRSMIRSCTRVVTQHREGDW